MFPLFIYLFFEQYSFATVVTSELRAHFQEDSFYMWGLHVLSPLVILESTEMHSTIDRRVWKGKSNVEEQPALCVFLPLT